MEKKKLSIIVPAYNVERYLEECIGSLLRSSYSNREIIIVNDGSTDATPAIGDRLAQKHRDVAILHKENAGLGQARNSGVAASDGDILAFVDSDDTVPIDAYTRMASSLAKSGSPFVVGGVQRFNSTKRWKPWFVEEVHAIPRLAIDAVQFPPVVWNVFAWSKLYRRADFEEVVTEFPSGLYEDQVMSARLYTSGRPVDVVPDIVYDWRAREDNSSITQNKTSTLDLRERIDVALQAADVIDGAGSEGLSEYWYRKLLAEDLWWYYRVVPGSTIEFWDALRTQVSTIVERAPASSFWSAQKKRRDLIALLLDGDRERFVKRVARP